nr:MAG TPA: hypothetical protein [Bacteriophage sp.]
MLLCSLYQAKANFIKKFAFILFFELFYFGSLLERWYYFD